MSNAMVKFRFTSGRHRGATEGVRLSEFLADYNGPQQRFKPAGDEEHEEFEPKILDVQYDLDKNERIITFKYEDEEDDKSFAVHQSLDTFLTTKVSSKNLTLKPVEGRGYTAAADTHVVGAGMANAHLIADRFGGSGYKESLNLISTSQTFNNVEMGRVERSIALAFVRYNAATMDADVNVEWGEFLDGQADTKAFEQIKANVMELAQESEKMNRQERISKFLQEQSSKNAIPARRCLEVRYFVIYRGEDGQKLGTFGPQKIGPDKWIKGGGV